MPADPAAVGLPRLIAAYHGEDVKKPVKHVSIQGEFIPHVGAVASARKRRAAHQIAGTPERFGDVRIHHLAGQHADRHFAGQCRRVPVRQHRVRHGVHGLCVSGHPADRVERPG